MKRVICYVDGHYLPITTAGVPVTDLLVQRGYGIFDFLRVSQNKPLFLEDHLTRFYNSANTMRLNLKESREELITIVYKLIEENQFEYSGLRLILGGGDSQDGYTISEPRLVILQQSLVAPPASLPTKGIKLVTYNYQRQLARVKTTDYLMAIYLQPWMKEQQSDDILYCSEGFVRECPRSNFFIVKDNIIITPLNNMLLGVTRKNIIRVAAANHLKLEERDLSIQEIKNADEAFITSSTKRLTSVRQIDDYVLPVMRESSVANTLYNLLKEEELK